MTPEERYQKMEQALRQVYENDEIRLPTDLLLEIRALLGILPPLGIAVAETVEPHEKLS